MTDFSTSDHLKFLLGIIEREMKHAKVQEANAASELAAERYRGAQGGLGFAARGIAYMLDSLREVEE